MEMPNADYSGVMVLDRENGEGVETQIAVYGSTIEVLIIYWVHGAVNRESKIIVPLPGENL